MNIDPRFEDAVKEYTPKQTKWTTIEEGKLIALRSKVELYEKALKTITRHAYKGIVMQTAHKALSQAKELTK
jgi:hypothetical protein